MIYAPPIERPYRRNRQRQQPEAILQRSVVQYLSAALPAGVWWSHIGHGARMSVFTASKLKAMGLKKGIPDLLIVPPEVGHIWIELKAAKGRVEPDQKNWLAILNAAPNSHAFVCRSVEAVESALRSAGVILKARLA